MKNAEEAIERVLSGMRDVEVPAEMRARILRAIETRGAELESRGRWPQWKTGRYAWRLIAGAAAAGLCALAIFGVATHGSDGRGVAGSGSLADAKEGVPQRLKPQDGGEGYGTAQAVPLSRTGRAPRDGDELSSDGEHVQSGGAQTRSDGTRYSSDGEQASNAEQNLREGRGVDGVTDYDALAVSEMLASSRPAPPLPLTHQENLLAEVVHDGDPEEVAELRPEVRAREREVAKAEFHDFFELPPPVKDNE